MPETSAFAYMLIEGVEMKVVGVDGCRGGWVAVCWDVVNATIEPRKHDSLADLITYYSAADAIGVDIPTGLSSAGSRDCDVAARKVLGRGRSSSVFPAPHPDILHVSTYQEAGEWSRSKVQKDVSQQTFAIFYKIAEANSTIVAGTSRPRKATVRLIVSALPSI
jgi:predicted RNase H-like nuclease